MRLTLRTMLAYLDGILEADDAQDIGKKIEDSQYATGLLHRIRDVMRRLRLAAPSISERGPGLDANTVAEYLDNTLPPDRVPDFEKVCLESDIHLAEVASCHQVLAAVLGEPVEIDPESRQRMYQLPQVAAQASAASRGEGPREVSGDGSTSADAASHQGRPRPMVPAYLREPPRRRSLLVTAVLLLLAGSLAGALLLALGFFEPGTHLGNLVRTGRWKAEVAVAPGPSQTDQGAVKGAEGKAGRAAADATTAKEKAGSKTTSPPVAALTQKSPASPLKPANATAPGNPVAPVGAVPPGPAPKAGTAAAPGKELIPGKAAVPGPDGTAIAKLPPGAAAVPIVEDIKPPGPPAELNKAASETASGEHVGRYSSEDQILLEYDEKAHDWRRVSPAEPLLTGQRLLAMPDYRDEITLDAGITLKMVGGTAVRLLPGSPQELPGLEVGFGRLVLQPVVEGGRKLRLTVGGRSGVLTLVDPESIVALEVALYHVPGTNPETEAPHLVGDLYIAHRGARWQEKGAAESIRLMAPARLPLDAQAPPEAQPIENKNLPKWLAPQPLSDLEQRGRFALAQALQVGRSADMGLKELAEHRKSEVARLARRCLGYLNDFDPAVAALEDPDQKQYWWENSGMTPSSSYIEQLRAAIARGPETAAAVREAMEKKFGPEEGAVLYRMLWGYTNQDLEGGADTKLVQLLDHEKLAFRVLSYWNLHDITALKLLYQPEQTAVKRRHAVTAWKQRREAGEIRIHGADEKPHVTRENLPADSPPPPLVP